MTEIIRIPTLSLTGGWETMLEGKAREKLEREVLPDYLRAQRWFGGKGRRIASLHFVDWGDFPARESRVFLLLLEVRFANGKSDLYFLPSRRDDGRCGGARSPLPRQPCGSRA